LGCKKIFGSSKFENGHKKKKKNQDVAHIQYGVLFGAIFLVYSSDMQKILHFEKDGF
jgi:hypothetical protein